MLFSWMVMKVEWLNSGYRDTFVVGASDLANVPSTMWLYRALDLTPQYWHAIRDRPAASQAYYCETWL